MVESSTIYIVKKGDSLYKIAKAHGLPDWRFLWGNNWKKLGKNPSLIHPGLELEIPNLSLWNCAMWIVELASYFNYWALLVNWLWWLYNTRPSEKEIVERAARDGIIGI